MSRKNGPKEQRSRKRLDTHSLIEKIDKTQPPMKTPSKISTKVPDQPASDLPGPDFYRGLKRETEDISKIKQEDYLKYKKKDIQGNWNKYEVPIEINNDIEESKSTNTDYEILIKKEIPIGGHFKFQHEKLWNVDTGLSSNDKCFEINMSNLALALCTIPFYLRNNIHNSYFIDTDFTNMDNRTKRFKQKYFNNMSYSAPQLEAQERILNVNTHLKNIEETKLCSIETLQSIKEPVKDAIKDISDINKITNESPIHVKPVSYNLIEPKCYEIESLKKELRSTNDMIENNIKSKHKDTKSECDGEHSIDSAQNKTDKLSVIDMDKELVNIESVLVVEKNHEDPVSTEKKSKNPVIESPEDLEKWLDDFLDD